MPFTLREQILAQLLVVLQAALSGAYRVWDHETRLPTAQELPVVNLLGLDHRPIEDGTGLKRYELDVDLDGWVSGADGTALRQAVGALYGAGLSAVSADPSLGGLAIDLRERETVVSYDTVEGHAPNANVTLSLVVEYAQREADPYSLAP